MTNILHPRARARKEGLALERVFIVFGVLSFINFDYLNTWGVTPVMNLLQMFMIVVSFGYLLAKRVRVGLYETVWVLIAFWIVLTTILHGADVSSALRLASKIMLPLLFFSAFQDDFRFVLRVVYVALGILVVANLITIIAYPNGMYVTGVTNLAYENWLLGFKNKHIVFYLPLMLAIFALIEADGVSWDKITVLCSIVLASLLAGSSTAIVCMALLVVLAFIPFFRERYHLFNARTYLVVGLALFLLVVLLRVQDGISAVVGLLGKDMTFSGRTLIWDTALQQISSALFTGHGYLSLDLRHMLYTSFSVMSAHDQLLEYAFVGGCALVALYLMASIILANRLQRAASMRVVQFAAAIYFGMLVVMLTEVYEDILFYALYFMLWNIPGLAQGDTHREENDCFG